MSQRSGIGKNSVEKNGAKGNNHIEHLIGISCYHRGKAAHHRVCDYQQPECKKNTFTAQAQTEQHGARCHDLAHHNAKECHDRQE